jgi:DNA polymerase-1
MLVELPKLLNERGVKTNSSPYYEADDLLGISSKYFSDKNKKVVIYTGDKDLLQLVDKNVEI